MRPAGHRRKAQRARVHGTLPATGVTLIDALPAQGGFVSASGGGIHDPAGNTVSWQLGDLAAGSTAGVTLQVQVAAGTPAGSMLVNTAQLQADNAAAVTASVQTPVAGSGQPPDVRPVPTLSFWTLMLLMLAMIAITGHRIRSRSPG